MVYQYKWNGPNRAVPAEKVAEHLQKLEEKNGSVTREDFLESARPEDSEMHKLFEWDDTVAAEKYRLYQANTIIHSISVTVQEDEKEPITLNAFVVPGYADHSDGKLMKHNGGYINIRRATEQKNLREEILEDARKNAKWFMNKYRSITELSKVIAAIEDFLGGAA